MYANLCSEKFLKKLAGRKDIEDALQRLDRLTQEEALMAAAQILNLTHRVDKKVTNVGNQVTDVGNQVTDIGNHVAGVGNKLNDVDDKMDVVVQGMPHARHSFAHPNYTYLG
jgi:predicted  nucleic acid-binding Zn-ribbon protein